MPEQVVVLENKEVISGLAQKLIVQRFKKLNVFLD